MNTAREKTIEIANDILEYCKKNNKRYFTSKYAAKDIINKKENRPYGVYELSHGVRYLLLKKIFTRVSKNRYFVNNFDLKKQKPFYRQKLLHK